METSSCFDSDSNTHDHTNKNANLGLLLPEDLMFRIFTLVPLNFLLNSVRYVCKSWAAAISNSRFIEACQLFHVRSKPGLYIENRKSRNRSYFLEFKDDVNGQFERTDLGTPKKMGHLIATCDGILLLLNTFKQVFVVNPILKCWLRIPRFPFSRNDQVFPCQCTITCVPRTAKFKLFHADVLEISGAYSYVFYVLRIGIDSSWKEIARKEAFRTFNRLYFSSRPLYNGGNDLYWITNAEVIVMDIDKEIVVREYPLPRITVDPFERLVTMYSSVPFEMFLHMGDRLSRIVSIDSYRTYQIYIFDFDSGNWSLYHEMRPFDYMTASGHNLNPRSVSFRMWINDQIIFQVGLHKSQTGSMSSRKNIHFGYNVKTKQLTKIEDVMVGDFEVWLHTNSLVSLPTTLHG
ncbi:uncharacterized protein LOC131618270 [Vicia villosa]|uniref:uncharacterized protein LOC131618270 n=1 Tax=Vicia villosa TaxID=3911 RepID=UPI00273AA327|nr:uncharacterized protein LOC131618270 [Vicia villosa]